jgi:hypothetical protein
MTCLYPYHGNGGSFNYRKAYEDFAFVEKVGNASDYLQLGDDVITIFQAETVEEQNHATKGLIIDGIMMRFSLASFVYSSFALMESTDKYARENVANLNTEYINAEKLGDVYKQQRIVRQLDRYLGRLYPDRYRAIYGGGVRHLTYTQGKK